jgi:hypothetical protein
MNCPASEQWHLLSMDLLDEAESTELLAHARACDACRAAFGRARQGHARLLRSFEVFGRHHDRLREQLMAAVPAELPPRTLRLRRRWRGLLDFVPRLDTPARRLAAVLAPAACILLAVGILLTPGKSAVAFAAVLERMRQARTMVCEISTTARIEHANGEVEENTYHERLSMYFNGIARACRRENLEEGSTSLRLRDRVIFTDRDGQRRIGKFSGGLFEERRDDDPESGPDVLLLRLLEATEIPDRKLGHWLIADRDTVGFEVAAWKAGFGQRPASDADEMLSTLRLWVDVETGWPVQLEHEFASRLIGARIRGKSVWENMHWNVPLDPREFEPPPESPDDIVRELHADRPSEEALIKCLRAYADQLERIEQLRQELDAIPGDHRSSAEVIAHLTEETGWAEAVRAGYPEKLEGDWLTSAYMARGTVVFSLQQTIDVATKLAAGDSPGQPTDREQTLEAAREMAVRLSLENISVTAPIGMFYLKLAEEGRQLEYFGATVKPGDSDAVLMRWKLDDSHWRVIYGDLRAETVPRDQQRSDTP